LSDGLCRKSKLQHRHPPPSLPIFVERITGGRDSLTTIAAWPTSFPVDPPPEA
jgi:hypothetical protein